MSQRSRFNVVRGPFGGKALVVGEISGIKIGLDRTWVIVLALVVYSLRANFLAEHPDWSGGLALGSALTTSLLFFTSILLHELGHSLVSNALGLPVRSITLFIFGGVAALSREPDRPRDEFLIAIAGPAVSAVLAVLFTAAAGFIPGDPLAFQVLGVICAWIGTINFILVVFNAIPGFPLDGGRVFRSFIWAVSGSYTAATRVASVGGGLFAALLISVGLYGSFAGGRPSLNGLWPILLGLFLLRTAVVSYIMLPRMYEARTLARAKAQALARHRFESAQRAAAAEAMAGARGAEEISREEHLGEDGLRDPAV